MCNKPVRQKKGATYKHKEIAAVMSSDSNGEHREEQHDKRGAAIGRRSYDSNIVRLIPEKLPHHAGTVELCRELLSLAEQGKMTGLAYVAIVRGGVAKGAVGIGTRLLNAIRGALLALANEM